METAVRDMIQSEARLGGVSSLHLSNIIAEVPKNADSSLCIGDIVMITAAIDCYETSEQLAPLIDLGTQATSKRAFASTTVFLEAEGVADPQVHAVEKGTRRLHTCLFTVLGCFYQKDSDTFSRKSEKEFDAKTEGEQVHFGDEVQLRHLNSGKFMSFSSTPAAFGFQITLEERMGRSTWIRLVGGVKSTKVGQPVYYHNRVVLQTKCDFIEYYMHLSGSSLPMLHFAVTAYSEPFSWTLTKFQSPAGNESDIQLMRPVVFSHKDLGLRLSHTKRQSEEWKQVPDLFSEHDSNKEEDILYDLTHEEEEDRLVLNGSADDGMCFWRIEDPSQSHGGTVEPNKPYLLRNVLTGEYLGNELSLGPEGAVFTLATTKVQTKSLVNGIDLVLKLEDGHLEAELDELSGKDVFRMIPSSNRAQIKGAAQVVLGRQSSESSRFTFEVYNLSKHLNTFVQKTVEFVPVFQGFYNTLANWGVVDSRIQELAALQQLKELRRQRDIVLRAIWFLEDQLTQNVVKEILEERQAFIVACNIHILLLRIAQMLMLRLGASEQKQLMLSNLTRGVEQILEEETRDLVAALMSLLNFTAFENPTVCKHLSRIDKDICALFPLNQRLVASLLAEIYRLIDPPIEDYETYFANWIGRLETLSQSNVEEQAVFLRLIRYLSEEDNEVNPASQLQLIQDLMRGSSPFKLIKISMLDQVAYVHFYEKGGKPCYVPDLQSIMRQIGNETYFLLAEMQGPLLKYSKYVAEALLLLNTLCKNENKESLQCVRGELGFTAQTVLRLSDDKSIHIVVRRSFVFLASTVILTRDCLGLSQTSGTISLPEAEEGEQNTYVRSSNTQVEELSGWCFDFWMGNSALNKTEAEASDLFDFLQSMLFLTSTLVDYKIATPAFATTINPAVEYLLICLVNPKSSYHTEPHWIDEIVQQAAENTLALAYRRKRVIQATISLIKLNYTVASRTKVQSILNCYLKSWSGQSIAQESWYAELQALIAPEKGISSQVKTKASLLLYAKVRSNNSRDLSIREPKMTEFISELLISNVKLSQDIRNMLFDLLRSVLTINLTISTQVSDTQLLNLPELQEYRNTLVDLSSALQIHKQETVLRMVFERYDQMKTDQVQFNLEKLLAVLCCRKKLSRDFLAIQNIARDLYLHRELIRLWEILQTALSRTSRKDNKLKANDLTRILSLTVYCLYYFALGHEANRQELLKLMRPQFYSLSVRIVPYLIQELTDFEHITQYSSWLCYQSVLQKCTFSSPGLLPGLEWIRTSMQCRGSAHHSSDLQGIAAMAILAHFQKIKISLLSPSDSESMSEMISLLAEAADGNDPVRKQCRALVSPELLKECFKSATRPSLVRAWTHLLQTVYGELAQDDIIECLRSVLPWLQRVAQASKSLITLGIDGLYDQVFPTNTPERVDVKEGGTIYENANLELWTMVSSGDEWAVKYGLCYSLPRILVTQSPPSEDFKNLCIALQDEILNINQIVYRLEKNYEQLDCKLLRKASFGCYKAFSLYLHGELDEAAMESIFEVHQLEEDLEQSKVQDVVAPPISLKSKQVLPLTDSMLLTKVPSLQTENQSKWAEFTRAVQLVCREHTLMPVDATRVLALQVPLVKKLTSSIMNNRERQDTVKAIKTMVKKLKPEFQSEVFTMFKVILEGSKSKSTTAEVFRDAGVLSIAVRTVVAQTNLKLMSAALDFLTAVMTHRNIAFQDWFLAWLTESETYVRLFQLIVNELSCSLDRMGHPEHLAPSERAFLSQYFTQGMSVDDLRTLNQYLLQQLLDLAKLCCDNCNSRFQMFMSVQNKSDSDPLAAERESIDLVSAVANYLVCVCQGDFKNNGEALIMLDKCLETLVEFVTGPCEDNQTRLGSDVQLIKALDVLLHASYERRDRASWVGIMLDALAFLHTCLEGHPNSEVLDTLLKHLNIHELLNALVKIYQDEIQFREARIMLEEESDNLLLQKPKTDVSQLIDVGFSIMMLLLKLQNLAPAHPDLVVLKSIEKKSELDWLDLSLGVLNHLPHECYAFYASLIGYVEISRNGTVEADFFKIPYKCKFLTVETKGKAIFKAMDASHHQKIQNFLHLTKLYKVEMDHQQHLYRIGWLKKFSQGWKIYGWISFLFILAINIALLAKATFNEVSYVDSEERKMPLNLLTICLGLLQLVFALVSYLCYLAEYYPNLAHKIVLNKVDSLEFPDYAEIWHNDSVLMKRESPDKGSVETDYKKAQAINFLEKAINLSTNFNTLYNICFLAVSSVSIVIPALYAVLLLDVFKRSEELVNIVRAVTQNKKQLVLTVIVGIIIVYMFSMAGIVSFQQYFGGDDNSMYCDTLWECFISEIHMGTRAGGGVADQLALVTLGDHLYYPRVIYDMLFFAVVVLIIQNIIFGIIVDTFGELRDEREQVLEELNTECYVCGVSRSVLERSGKGWAYHFLNEHSLFAYMAFITYVEEKDESDCTGLEKYVKDKIARKDTSFFPSTSKYLQDMDIDVSKDE